MCKREKENKERKEMEKKIPLLLLIRGKRGDCIITCDCGRQSIFLLEYIIPFYVLLVLNDAVSSPLFSNQRI